MRRLLPVLTHRRCRLLHLSPRAAGQIAFDAHGLSLVIPGAAQWCAADPGPRIHCLALISSAGIPERLPRIKSGASGMTIEMHQQKPNAIAARGERWSMWRGMRSSPGYSTRRDVL